MGKGAVLVTGATGFLGACLARRLLREGYPVHALLRPGASVSRLDRDAPGVVPWQGDVTDHPALLRILRATRPEIVFHLAGDTTGRRFGGDWAVVDRALQVNVSGTLNLVHAAAASGAPPRVLVRTGGLEEYGIGLSPFDEMHRERPRSPYSASQVAATHWCQMLQPHLPFAIVTLRPALVYGPSQSPEFLIPGLICALLRGQRYPMTAGRQRRDFIYVEDFAEAACLAGSADGLHGSVLNISSGRSHTVRSVAVWIAREVAARPQLAIGSVPDRPLEVPDLMASNALARRRLGWLPQVVLADGLRRTIEWYRGTLND